MVTFINTEYIYTKVSLTLKLYFTLTLFYQRAKESSLKMNLTLNLKIKFVVDDLRGAATNLKERFKTSLRRS